jgi:hypothetical protein
MMRPGPTRSPASTDISERYETDTFDGPRRIVTVLVPATTPAKVTSPPIGAATSVPTSAARSIPQWPA